MVRSDLPNCIAECFNAAIATKSSSEGVSSSKNDALFYQCREQLLSYFLKLLTLILRNCQGHKRILCGDRSSQRLQACLSQVQEH
jgi:hypothetical protein